MSFDVLPVTHARVCLVLAALIWSLGSVFMRLLAGAARARPRFAADSLLFKSHYYRGLFGGLVILALVRRRRTSRFRPLMLGMVVAFTVMSGLYLSALGSVPRANAIFLQNTAPVWVYLSRCSCFVNRPTGAGFRPCYLPPPEPW